MISSSTNRAVLLLFAFAAPSQLSLRGKPPLSTMQWPDNFLHLRCGSWAFVSHQRWRHRRTEDVANKCRRGFHRIVVDLWLSTVGCMMQFSNNFLHLRLWLLKLVKGKPNGA